MELRPGASLSGVALADLEDACRILANALRPAPSRTILEALAACDAVTVGKDGEPFDAKVRGLVFAEDLAEFPADAVVEAFHEHRRESKWRPTVVDIRERCLMTTAQRRGAMTIVRAELARRQDKAKSRNFEAQGQRTVVG